MVRRESRRARTIPRRSPPTSVTPALSSATSAPAPIAMPTWARARAGASLMPSPAMATTRPSASRRATTSPFAWGSTSAYTSSMPSRRATASAVVRLSPLTMTTRMPSAWSAASASGVDGFQDDRLALAAQGLGARPEVSRVDADLVEERPVAECDNAALDHAGHALASDRAEAVDRRRLDAAGARAGYDRRREGVLAGALEPGREA